MMKQTAQQCNSGGFSSKSYFVVLSILPLACWWIVLNGTGSLVIRGIFPPVTFPTKEDDSLQWQNSSVHECYDWMPTEDGKDTEEGTAVVWEEGKHALLWVVSGYRDEWCWAGLSSGKSVPKCSAGMMAPRMTWDNFLSLSWLFLQFLHYFSKVLKCRVAKEYLRDDLRVNDEKCKFGQLGGVVTPVATSGYEHLEEEDDKGYSCQFKKRYQEEKITWWLHSAFEHRR